jgi:hypothetical protein
MAELGRHGVEILEALAEGQAFRRSGDGWRAGMVRASAALIGEMARAALVREEADALLLTPAGRARASHAKRPARPIRLLAERALPDPAPSGPRRARRSVTVNLMESPLGWLRARGLIDQRQFDAGERLRADWTMANLGPRVTMRWDAAPLASGRRGADAPLDPTLAGIAAKRRFDGAVEAAGKGLADVLWRVVCAGEGLEAAETALGWPRRAGKLVLLMALDRVADYYGIR